MILITIFSLFFSIVMPDEGMWLLNDFPKKELEKKYSYKVDDKWLNQVMLSSVRLAGGCSGSFVSNNGLIMTNHHCANSCIEQISSEKQNYVETGFYAKTLKDEVKCPEMEINQLIEITDVTSDINKKTKNLNDAKFNDALKAEMSRLEKKCSNNNDNLRCEVVTLFKGGKYHLYRYKRYQDVRLVFAPEFAIAFFGGDPDNFTFPRYDLDVSFVRVYNKDQPLKNDNFFKFSNKVLKEGNLTFVTGHPGRTSRLITVSEFEYLRDVKLINQLMYLAEIRGLLTEFQNRGKEQKRYSNEKLFYIENSFKAIKGRLNALLDKNLFESKISEENKLRKKVNASPELKKKYASAWNNVTLAINDLKAIVTELNYLENGLGFNSDLFGLAKTIVRASDELKKPNEERLREYTDSNLPVIKQYLYSTAPIHDDLEILLLTFSITKLRENLGADSSFVKKVLGNKSPAELAKYLITNTKLKDVKLRKELFEKGSSAVTASKDAMIQFALSIDNDARSIRKKYEDDIESKIKKNSELIAKANFAIKGTNTYPDATFTLRISYGAVKGYNENNKYIKPYTVIEGAFNRHTGRDPYTLPNSWLTAKDQINLKNQMNFCTTNDIIGGNSGSPVINKDMEAVGLIFDGNIQSLGSDYGFDETINRAVAVNTSAIAEALKVIYKADRIYKELLIK